MTIRSQSDFADHFRGPQLVTDGLTESELEVFSNLESPKQRRGWLLQRLSGKALVQRYCETHFGEAPAASAIDWDPTAAGRALVRWVTPGGAPAAPLAIATFQKAEFGSAAVRPLAPGAGFGVSLVRVEPRYPFFPEAVYTEPEVERLRNYPPVEADAALAGVWALKVAIGRALEGASDQSLLSIEVTALSTTGESAARVYASANESPPVVRSQAWFFGSMVFAFAAIWSSPSLPPPPTVRFEENPVLPAPRRTSLAH